MQNKIDFRAKDVSYRGYGASFLYLNFENILHNYDYEVYTGLVLLVL